jgi:RHS repeat-associated protein
LARKRDLLLATDSGSYTLYLGATELHKDGGSATASAVRTYTANGTAIAERTTVAGVSGTTLRWLATDNHDTALLEVNSTSGAITSRYQDPYGNPRGTTTTWSTSHTFLNADQADTSNTIQLGARAYDSTLGRFLSVDSVLAPMNPLQDNGYAYAANDPIMKADPSGECYNSETGAFNMLRNCAGTNSQNGYQKGANNIPQTPKAAGNSDVLPPSHVLGVHLGADGTLRSDADAWQLTHGYDDWMDRVVDATLRATYHKKYIFVYGSTSYVIWVWKAWYGGYGGYGDGGEVGIYDQPSSVPDPGGHWYANAHDPNLPLMSESLTINGLEIASSAPKKPQPWVASFHPGANDMNADDLKVRDTVTFRSAAMYEAFMKSPGVARAWTSDPTTPYTAVTNY